MQTARWHHALVDYKPGDVANGHVLGPDNQWHPLVPPPYSTRYSRRWRWTALVMGVLVLVDVLSIHAQIGWHVRSGASIAAVVIDLVLRFFIGGALFGSGVNLLVALVPGGAPVPAKKAV